MSIKGSARSTRPLAVKTLAVPHSGGWRRTRLRNRRTDGAARLNQKLSAEGGRCTPYPAH